MRCIKCYNYSQREAWCGLHMPGDDRFKHTLEKRPRLAEEHLAKIIKGQWTEEEKPEVITDQDVEYMLAENHNLMESATKYMIARGYGNWIHALPERMLKYFAADVKIVSPHKFSVELDYNYNYHGKLWRNLGNCDPSSQDGFEFTFFNYNANKVKKFLMTACPLTEWPDIKVVKREYGDIVPCFKDTWTSHVAINRGEISGGTWITDKHGYPVRFKSIFNGTVIKHQGLGAFGLKNVCAATTENLKALIMDTQQPWSIKLEANDMLVEEAEKQKLIAQSFQWRLNTKPYKEGELHRYAYTQEDNFPFASKEKRIGENWNSYINAGYKLFSHQKVCCEVAWRYKRIGLWLDMRLGKTLIGIAIAKRALKEGLIDKIVVVCPVTNMYNPWYTELDKQNLTVYTCDQGKDMDINAFDDDDYNVYVISYESLRNRLPHMQDSWDMERICVIMDETSAIKNPDAKRTKAAIQLTEHPEFVLCLNGTPMEQGPADIWAQQYCVDRGRTFGVNVDHFRYNFMFQGEDRRWYLQKRRRMQFELCLAASSMRYIRSEGDQFAGKDKNFRYVVVPPTEEMHMSTARIIKGFQVTDWGDAQLVKNCILVSYGHLREASAAYDKYEEIPDSGIYKRRRHKLDPKNVWVRTFLQSNPGQPLVCYSEFSEAEDRLMEMLENEGIKYSTTRPLGSKSPYSAQVRDMEIEKFNKGETRVFVCKTMQARGITLNRLEAVSNGIGTYPAIVYMQPSWSLGAWKQSQDRCVGTDPNTKKSISTMVYVLAVQGSIEQLIVKALRGKDSVAASLLKDAQRSGYENPFEEMDLTGGEEMDDFFDAEDYEARYQLQLAPPPKKLTEQMVMKANARYLAKKRFVTVTQAKDLPLCLYSQFLINKIKGDVVKIAETRGALNADNVIEMDEHRKNNTQEVD